MRNIPIVTKNLLILNIVVYLFAKLIGENASGNFLLSDYLGLHFFMASDFHVYQFITYMFMHAGFDHILFNMFALWMFGCVVERVWGAKKFLFYYMACGIGAGLSQEIAQFFQAYVMTSNLFPTGSVGQLLTILSNSKDLFNQPSWTTVGASGSIFGILLAFGMIYPEDRIFIFPIPVPIKAKYFVIGYAAVELYLAWKTTGDGVAHIAHLGGMVFGFFMIRYWRKQVDGGYGGSAAKDAFEKMCNAFAGRKKQQFTYTRHAGAAPHDKQDDWNYNAQKKASQEEIDRILDKIRRNGYDSLTREEKKTLFDQSNK